VAPKFAEPRFTDVEIGYLPGHMVLMQRNIAAEAL